jgi:hypothetical protein
MATADEQPPEEPLRSQDDGIWPKLVVENSDNLECLRSPHHETRKSLDVSGGRIAPWRARHHDRTFGRVHVRCVPSRLLVDDASREVWRPADARHHLGCNPHVLGIRACAPVVRQDAQHGLHRWVASRRSAVAHGGLIDRRDDVPLARVVAKPCTPSDPVCDESQGPGVGRPKKRSKQRLRRCC